MQVHELIKKLSAYPQEMEVVMRYCSDYSLVESLKVIEAVDKGYYVMEVHETMSAESRVKKKSYIEISNYE